jgi:hypothetical protein
VTVRELMAKAIQEKTRPAGPPLAEMQPSEQAKFYAAADACLEVIWTFDRDE